METTAADLCVSLSLVYVCVSCVYILHTAYAQQCCKNKNNELTFTCIDYFLLNSQFSRTSTLIGDLQVIKHGC